MSISPAFGQPVMGSFSPSIQNAGQVPLPTANFIDAWIFPYLKVNPSVIWLGCVVILAEVIEPSRLPQPGGGAGVGHSSSSSNAEIFR